MATERNFNAVPPVLLTSDGTTEGILQVVDTAGFYVQMQALLQNNLSAKLTVYIKRVVDSTTLWVGPTNRGMDHNVDVSAFTLATASSISAAEQPKATVPMEGRLLATYENDPVDAWRTIPVDQYGNHYNDQNPLPISFDGTVQIGQVRISAIDNDPAPPTSHSSVRIGGSDDSSELEIHPDGSADVRKVNTLVIVPYDTIQITAQTSAGDPSTILFKTGGLAGTTVSTLNLAYDSEDNLLSVVRT